MSENIENEIEKVLVEAQNFVTKRFTELGIQFDESPEVIYVDDDFGKTYSVRLSYMEIE